MATYKKKLAIITTHPIQYNAPLFKLLAQRKKLSIKVFYTWGETVLNSKYDPGFRKEIKWDIPLLEGYEYEFLENKATDKGSHHFKGIDNPQIINALENYSPDAILVYGWSFKSHLKLLRYFHNKVPVFFRGDSTLLNDTPGGLKSLIRKIFLKWVYKHIDYAFYVGKNNCEYYKNAGLKPEQLVYAPHAIDNERFNGTAASHEQALVFRQQLGLNADDLVFLFAGKLEKVKDPFLLLNAFIDSGIHKDAHLVFVGNGHLEDDLREMAKAVNNIHFMGFQNQSLMPSIYHMADVYVLPSISETWGLALNESMAAGCAIIASDKCGAAVDLIDNGKNGFIFKSGDKNDLTAKMKIIYDSKDVLATMKKASQQKVKEFSFLNIAEAIENVLLLKIA
jgi:glycosyltransferase involved in cell wall biosynthesis